MRDPREVYIDGSIGEGGGQVLRTSLALACITGKTVHIANIRAARRNPGLARQHLACVQAARQICNAHCEGARLVSKALDFRPAPIGGGDYHLDVGSAGSASLVMQTILPTLFLAKHPSRVTVAGGTHNPWAPPFGFVSESFLPAILTAGFEARCELIKPGFFPAGGGKIVFEVEPWTRNKGVVIDLCEPHTEPELYARIYTAKLPARIAQRQRRLLRQSGLLFRNIEHVEVKDSEGAGNCVLIRICSPKRVTVFASFGMRGRPSERVIAEVVDLANDFLAGNAAVDRFLADQLLIYMAISQAGCFTTNQVSSHLLTNIEVIKEFLPVDFSIDHRGQMYKICCNT
jgi:RNA 3'-terminal phosphate cyclase (ATP)